MSITVKICSPYKNTLVDVRVRKQKIPMSCTPKLLKNVQFTASIIITLFFYLQPGDDYEVIEGSQFVVSRTARKDNSSDYHVNGRKVPFKEVARLLKDCGIDLDHNRFLILQVGLTFKTNVHYVDPYLPFIRSCGVS